MNSDRRKEPDCEVKEFIIRAPPADNTKKYSVIQFQNTDLTKFQEARIERENNVKNYKLSHNIDQMPKFGSGSEYGREAKDEARRKKFGVRTKKYIIEDQPYLLNLFKGKEVKKFKSQQVGSIQSNANYYVFTQCTDGAFQIMPVDQYHKFTQVSSYKTLDPDEAEKQFEKRNKTMNYFSIMLQKKISGEDKELDDDDLDIAAAASCSAAGQDNSQSKKKKKKSAKQRAEEGKKQDRKNFMLTEMDSWVKNDSDLSSPPDSEDDLDEPKKKSKDKKSKVRNKNKKKENSDEEALEESDEFNEGKEVDYMTSSDSNDDCMYSDKQRDNSKYEEKGVEDEAGLRALVESESSDSDSEKKKSAKDMPLNLDRKKESSSDSSDSDSDSDFEKNPQFTSSALLMQNRVVPDDGNSQDSMASDDEITDPVVNGVLTMERPNKKRRRVDDDEYESSKSGQLVAASLSGISVASSSSGAGASTSSGAPGATDAPPHKHQLHSARKPRNDPAGRAPLTTGPTPVLLTPAVAGVNDSDRTLITSESIRRYLLRKPMTTAELIQKFKAKNTGLKKQDLVTTIVQTLKLVSYKMMKTKENKLLLYVKPEVGEEPDLNPLDSSAAAATGSSSK